MINKKIGTKIKFERMKLNLSQDDLAQLSGLSKNTVWKIECGKVSATIDSLEKIAKALKIDLADIVNATKVDI